MRAVVQDAYGSPDLLRVAEVAEPVPAADEVLVRVRAASVHPDVWHVVTGRPYALRLMGSGLRRPRERVPGTDVAGVVEAVGAGVTRFRPGDAVFGETLQVNQWRNGGAYAELAVAPEDGLALLPANVSFEAAASVPTSGLIALHNVPAGHSGPDASVLVNGAGGGVGSLAVQIAKAYGATVTGVDLPARLDLARGAGADHVVDASVTDVTRAGERYDLVVDIPGNHPYRAWRRILRPDGRYALVGHDHYGAAGHGLLGSLPRFAGLLARSVVDRHLSASVTLPPRQESLETLRALLESGALTPVVDRTFGLDEAPEAIRRLTSGASRGKVLITP